MLEVIVFSAAAVASVSCLVYALHVKKHPNIQLMADGDEDMRIADGNFGSPQAEDHADEAAAEFLRQKDAGNIEVAARFGELLACELWGVVQELLMQQGDIYTEREVHQKVLLYTYAINSLIADSAPYAILAETALSVFYSKLEELSSILYQHVSDTAGFSLYILNHRADDRSEEIGRIYAKLSGAEADAEKIREGNRIFNSFYAHCKKLYEDEIAYKIK